MKIHYETFFILFSFLLYIIHSFSVIAEKKLCLQVHFFLAGSYLLLCHALSWRRKKKRNEQSARVKWNEICVSSRIFTVHLLWEKCWLDDHFGYELNLMVLNMLVWWSWKYSNLNSWSWILKIFKIFITLSLMLLIPSEATSTKTPQFKLTFRMTFWGTPYSSVLSRIAHGIEKVKNSIPMLVWGWRGIWFKHATGNHRLDVGSNPTQDLLLKNKSFLLNIQIKNNFDSRLNYNNF